MPARPIKYIYLGRSSLPQVEFIKKERKHGAVNLLAPIPTGTQLIKNEFVGLSMLTRNRWQRYIDYFNLCRYRYLDRLDLSFSRHHLHAAESLILCTNAWGVERHT